MVKLNFLPEHIEVEIAEGDTIMAASEKAGVFISSLCGGICGSHVPAPHE